VFFIVSSFVFLDPEIATYSQDLMAKKNAPIYSLHNALLNGESAYLKNIYRMEAVMATCGFGGLSVDKYPLSCLCRMKESLFLLSNLGSGRSAILKA
jgi:hypothetical protein